MNISQKIRKGIIATVLVSSALTLTTTTPASAGAGLCQRGDRACAMSGSSDQYRFNFKDSNLHDNAYGFWGDTVGDNVHQGRVRNNTTKFACFYQHPNYGGTGYGVPYAGVEWLSLPEADASSVKLTSC
jgi:hypothetical protein